jgi:lysophospholipase L1-like esterase
MRLVLSIVILLPALLAGCQQTNPVDTMTFSQSPATTPVNRPEYKFWVERHERFNRIASEGDAELVFVGDSITQNWERKGKDVWEHYYGHRKAANFGINSDRTQHVLWRVQNGNFDGFAPKLIVLLIGTNNQTGAQATAEGVLAIVQEIRRRTPESKVLMLAIFPRGKDASDANRPDNAKASEIFSRIADGREVFYLDIGEVFMNDDGSISPEVMPDFVHLSTKGYQLWAEAIEPTVSRLLGDQPVAPPTSPACP